MEVIVERPAALDVHKAKVTACVRVPNDRGEREERVAEFATTVRGLLALRDWLGGHGVQQVVMEATGVYWKAPWAILEDEFGCLLVNARHVKQVPGRKTDVSDAAWLCRLAEAGLLKASFVPPKPIRQLRNLTRYRKTQIHPVVERLQQEPQLVAPNGRVARKVVARHSRRLGATGNRGRLREPRFDRLSRISTQIRACRWHSRAGPTNSSLPGRSQPATEQCGP